MASRAGKIHHYSSLLVFMTLTSLIALDNPNPMNSTVKIAVVKKKTGEEVSTFFGTDYALEALQAETGYLVTDESSNESTDCGKIQIRPNGQSTYFLDNLQNKCDLTQRLRLLMRAGYHAMIAYNCGHIYEKLEKLQNNPKLQRDYIKVIVVDKEDAKRLNTNYAHPKSVRFFISTTPVSGGLVSFNGIYKILKHIPVLRANPFLMKMQLWIYALMLCLIWRFGFVPKRFNILDVVYIWANNPYSDFEILNLNKVQLPSETILQFLRIVPKREKRTHSHIDMRLVQKVKCQTKWAIPVTLTDFQFVTTINYGAFGKISEEIFLRRNENVAMKSLLRTDQSISLLEMQILACGKICESIIPLQYTFVSHNCVHFVMELMQGSLVDFIEDLKFSHACIYTVELGLAIEALHSFGIAHRDIKPGNIGIDKNFHIKLGDFGISIPLEDKKTKVEEFLMGTFVYWASENYQMCWTKESDWWSFGCVVYAMFTKKSFLTDKLEASLKGETVTTAQLKSRVDQNITSPLIRKLLHNCFSLNTFRTPLGKSSFTKETKFMGIPIPIDRNVNIGKYFSLRTPHWENVSGGEEAINFGNVENILKNFPVEIPLRDTFYFDETDLDCYRNNPLMGHIFN